MKPWFAGRARLVRSSYHIDSDAGYGPPRKAGVARSSFRGTRDR
jgi:hypothetical protein